LGPDIFDGAGAAAVAVAFAWSAAGAAAEVFAEPDFAGWAQW